MSGVRRRSVAGGGQRSGSLASGFIQAGPADVAHPFDDVMIGVVQFRLKHLKNK